MRWFLVVLLAGVLSLPVLTPLLVLAADDSYSTKVYVEQGGDRQVIASGGSLDVESGGEIDIESGGSLKIAGTAMSGTASELNVLAGVTPGTAAASKAVVLGSDSKIDAMDITALTVNGTLVSSTAAELNKLDGATVVVAELNSLVRFPGSMASAVIDFNAAGAAAMNVTIDGVAYTEADSADAPNGIWTNGASANDSATSLIAAINGDTRATVPFTAVAGVDTDSVYLFWDAAGSSGNVSISSSDATATVENSLDGAAAAIKQTCVIRHTATTQSLLSGGVEIPLPFTPSGFNLQVRASTGIQKFITDLVTIQSSPDRIRLVTDGATNAANGDTLDLFAWE